MRLDRNINKDGRGKYALILMRSMPTTDKGRAEVDVALATLHSHGMLDYGAAGSPSEFFLIRLKDRFAGDALRAYADAAKRYADTFAATNEEKFQSFYAWACEVLKMAGRSGELSDHCKEPD